MRGSDFHQSCTGKLKELLERQWPGVATMTATAKKLIDLAKRVGANT